MNFGVNQRPQTGSLADISAASFAPIKTKPELKTAPAQAIETAEVTEVTDPSQIAHAFGMASPQGDSLTSVMIFPDEPSESVSPEKSPAVVRGERILSDLHSRRDPQNDLRGATKSTDVIVAKMFQNSHLQGDISQLKQSLEKVALKLRGLDNPDAPALSRSEIDELNAQLKRFGLMTDGLQLYNLSLRKSAGPGQPRVPFVCSKHEVEQLKDVCAAMLAATPVDNKAILLSKPQGGVSEDPLGLSKPVDFFAADAFSPEALPPANTYENIVIRSQKYDAMLSEITPFLNDAISLVDNLIAEQDQVNQQLTKAIEQSGTLSAKIEAQETLISTTLDIEKGIKELPEMDPSPQALSALNKKLEPSGLSIGINAKGNTVFKQNGVNVSAGFFKTAIHELLASQTKGLASLYGQLSAQQAQVTDLTKKSEVMSQRIEEVQETRIKPALKAIDTINAGEQENLEWLYAQKNDKAHWSTLSPEKQSEINALIASRERALEQTKALASKSNATLSNIGTALNVAEKLRGTAALVIEKLGQTKAHVSDRLNQLDKLVDQGKKHADKAQALIDAANALKITTSTPESFQMTQRLSEDVLSWITDMEQRFHSDTQRHQGLQAQLHLEQETLDRTLSTLRESVLYHQDQLTQMAEGSRERALNVLTSALEHAQSIATQHLMLK